MMKMSVMYNLRKGYAAMLSLSFLLLMSLSLSSCDKRNIHQVVKEMAEAPVDTVGFVSRSLHTNPFSTVDIDCFADVTYFQTPAGGDHLVVMKALPKVIGNLEVLVEDGDLVVGVDRRYRMPDKAVAVIEIYAPFVNRFVLDGGKCLRLGKMSLTSPLELSLHGNVGAFTADSLAVHELSLSLNGSGSFDMKNIETGNLRVKTDGNGYVKLAGKCRSAVFFMKDRGMINATGLKSDSCIMQNIEGRGVIQTINPSKK